LTSERSYTNAITHRRIGKPREPIIGGSVHVEIGLCQSSRSLRCFAFNAANE